MAEDHTAESSESPAGIGRRKAEHLEICVDERTYEVENGGSLLEEVSLVHRALPEVNASRVDTRSEFLGSPTTLPIFISSMTGGSAEAYKANKDLARVAQEAGIPVGMGSIRILFRNPEVIDHFRLKEIARDVPVFANIGGVQLRQGSDAGGERSGPGRDEVGQDFENLIEVVKALEVDGIAVHLNPGQELAQPEGDREFTGILDGIHELAAKSPVPLIVKETGFGIGPDEAAALVEAGATYVDVAGSGGTNWMTVESFRLADRDRAVADEFAGWGIPTGAALRAIQLSDLPLRGKVLASGGIRSGMDVVKSLALGSVAAGLALPFIRAVARGGVDEGLQTVQHIRSVLRKAMILTGSQTVEDLRNAPLIVSSTLAGYAEGLTRLHRV